MITETHEGESGSDSEEAPGKQATPRWRKMAVWLFGALLLGFVGYRSALGAREPAPIRATEERAPAAVTAATGGERPEEGAAAAEAKKPEEVTRDSMAPAADAPGEGAPTGSARAHASGSPRETSVPAPAPSPAEKKGTNPPAITDDGRVVLNLATEAELRKLPGIGRSRARAILAHREKLGRFRRLEDLLRVKGIGPKRLASLRAKLVLDTP